MVTITYRGELRDLIGKPSDSADIKTVAQVLKFVKKTYGDEAGKIAKRQLIVVNGKSILLLKNMRTELKDGDIVGFLPIAGGG